MWIEIKDKKKGSEKMKKNYNKHWVIGIKHQNKSILFEQNFKRYFEIIADHGNKNIFANVNKFSITCFYIRIDYRLYGITIN